MHKNSLYALMFLFSNMTHIYMFSKNMTHIFTSIIIIIITLHLPIKLRSA